jgi:hypothetical protein
MTKNLFFPDRDIYETCLPSELTWRDDFIQEKIFTVTIGFSAITLS